MTSVGARSDAMCYAERPSSVASRRIFNTRHKTSISRLFKRESHNLDSPMQFTEDDVLMEGILTKLSTSKYFSSKACYCILRSDTWSLCQYKTSQDLILLGETVLSPYDIVRDVSDVDAYAFELLRPTSNQSVRFATTTSRLLEQWVCALETAIFELCQLSKQSRRLTESPKARVATDVLLTDNSEPEVSSIFAAADILEEELRRECNNNDIEDDDGDNNNDHRDNQGDTSIEDKIAAFVTCSPDRSLSAAARERFFRRVQRVAPDVNTRRAVHSFSASGQMFTLDVKYKLIKPIGTGAYGAVISATDKETGENVAIKKISNIFDDLVDAKRILRETRLLGHFNHKNITRLLDLPPPPSRAAFDDMYIIAELMETDLHQVIYSMQPMSDDHVKYFLYQILCALHHIHSAGVIHRDMKPSNILLNSNCDLKICDFGLARGGFPDNIELTEYVVTRWYRAPEIMLNCLHYTEAVDMWAVGCILAEMIQREPLFPGNDYIHQLKLIIKFMGTPKQDEVDFVKNAKAQRFLSKLPIYKASKFQEAFPTANAQAIDLLERMLVFNPAKRISVMDALHHPYLEAFYDAADLLESSPFDFGFDIPDDQLTRDALVDLLMEDIATFHPEVKLEEPSSPPPPLPRSINEA
ncbi:hypothetical protein LEN26_000292 [Aphanomyces euteiches]|nr:hypothetical protein LEN26_000292 [Aphanomyces euteiches]